MTITNTLKTGLRAGVVALALAGSTFVATAPVQAASPNFGFSLNFGTQSPKGGIVLHFGDDNYFDYCLTNKQIVKALNNKGYKQVKIVKESNKTNKIWAVGRKNGDWYQLRVDRCTGKVDQIKKIYPKNGNGANFNLTFTF